MSRLRFWHPVLCAETLPKDRPVGIRVAGRDLAVFRTPAAVWARWKTSACIAGSN